MQICGTIHYYTQHIIHVNVLHGSSCPTFTSTLWTSVYVVVEVHFNGFYRDVHAVASYKHRRVVAAFQSAHRGA